MPLIRGGWRGFLLIWAGQVFSQIGSNLTGFALGVWIYQKTGSATQFALIAMAAVLPGVLLSPVAGVMVDRYDRRKILILADAAAALVTLCVALLWWMDLLAVWQIFISSALLSSFGAFQRPAFSASITLLVDKSLFARASGLSQTAESLSIIVAPITAGLLVVKVGLGGVILVDFVTFLIAMTALALVGIPRPEKIEEDEARPSMWSQAVFGWNWLRERPGLFRMLWLFAGLNFLFGMVNALLMPMVLSFTTADVMGRILSFGGFGGLLGGVALSIWGGPKKKMTGVLAFLVIISLGVSAVGLKPSAWFVSGALFGTFFFGPFINGLVQAVWQTKVPPGLQGRVFSTRGMISTAMIPISFLISGPLADNLFSPMMLEGGAWASRLGPIIGVGPGRGIGLMFVLAGIGGAIVSLIAYADPHIRHVEDRLPDQVGEEGEALE